MVKGLSYSRAPWSSMEDCREDSADSSSIRNETAQALDRRTTYAQVLEDKRQQEEERGHSCLGFLLLLLSHNLITTLLTLVPFQTPVPPCRYVR